jgi:hypothetical protein
MLAGIAAAMLSISANPVSASETLTYNYDALGRVTAISRSGGPNSGVPSTTSYDQNGNRTNYTVGNTAPPPPPGPVSFSIQNAPAIDAGANSVFTITKTGTTSTTQSINYATASGTAISGTDFTATSGSLNFLFWETQKTVAVPTIKPSTAQPAKTFTMSLSGASSGAVIGTATATGSINAASAPNQPPVANPDSATVGICQSAVINVVANDTDPEGNYPLTLVSVDSGTLGSASVYDGSNVRYGAYGVTGGEQITYTVQDSLGNRSTGIIGINIVDNGGCM